MNFSFVFFFIVNSPPLEGSSVVGGFQLEGMEDLGSELSRYIFHENIAQQIWFPLYHPQIFHRPVRKEKKKFSYRIHRGHGQE